MTIKKTVLLMVMCVFAWLGNATAADLQYNIEEYYDASASIDMSKLPLENFETVSGRIRKPYQIGSLWLRLTLDTYSPNLVLYFENATVDEVFLIKPDPGTENLWRESKIPMLELLRGHYLPDQMQANSNGKFEFYLKVKSSATKQFNVMVLSSSEAKLKQNIRYAILSSQLTAAIILMIWVVMQNWLARSKIFLTVIISVPLFVLSRLNYFGFFLESGDTDTSQFLNINMALFLTLISGGTLMVKESFGRLFTHRQNKFFLALVCISLSPLLFILSGLPRAYVVAASLGLNFLMIVALCYFLVKNFRYQPKSIPHYKYQLVILFVYTLMSMLPGLYFVLPQIFPTPLGIPAYRDYFYPVLAFLIMLLMLNEQKEKEMDSIFTLAVTKANAELEVEKNKKQHVFLGMLLHEIKTPLSIIKFGANALKTPNLDDQKNKQWAIRVDGAVDSINHILNQCLLADKFEFGLSGYKAERINIYQECIKIVERVGHLHPSNLERIEFQFGQTISVDTLVSVDPIFLRSILENLLSNGLKYSSANSTVFLNVATISNDDANANGKQIRFEVKNQIGKVGPPQIDKIFSRYYRAEEAKGYSGTGLGLWLADQQAKEMGASIECHIDPNWTSFSFTLPQIIDVT